MTMKARTKHIVIPYKPRPLQKILHKSLQRFNVLVCHRRFGKTVFSVNEIIKTALISKKDKPRVAYVAPTYAQAKRIAWDYAKEYTRVIPNINYNESELRVDFPNGARLNLYSADNPDSLRGIYLDEVVLDEYAQISPKLWGQVIRPALSDRKGKAIFIGTPQGHNSFYDLYTKAQGLPDWHTALYKASETGIVDIEELEAARREMTEAEYAQEYECSWEAAIRGAYYADYISDLDSKGQITNVPYDPALPVHTAWDLGVSDSTAIWFIQLAGQEIHVIDYYENTGQGLQHYIQYLQSLPYIYGTHIAPPDIKVREFGNNAKTRYDTAKELGIEFDKNALETKVKVKDGIEAVRSILPRCWFDAERTRDGLDALRQYREQYNDIRQVAVKPLHDWTSHAADAFRYYATSRITSQQAARRKTWDEIDYPAIGLPTRRTA